MADAPPEKAPEAAVKKPLKKKKKKAHKVHKAHKFHEDHKVAAVEPPPPSPEPPPPPTPEPVAVTPEPPHVVHCEKKDEDAGWYFGGAAGSFQLDLTGLNVNGAGRRARVRDSVFGGYGNFGYNFNRNIAVELRVGGTEQARNQVDGGALLGVGRFIPVTLFADTDAFYSAFVKGTIPIGHRFGVYGLLGATHYVVDAALNAGPLIYREDYNNGDLSFGGGVEARIGHHFVVGAEYVQYIDDNDGGVAVQLDGAVGRVQWRF